MPLMYILLRTSTLLFQLLTVPMRWTVSSVKLSRALSAMDTLRSSFKRCGAKGVYRQMSCRGITRQSAVLYRLLTQTIEAPKKRNRTTSNLTIKVSGTSTNVICVIDRLDWHNERREGLDLVKYDRQTRLVIVTKYTR